MNDASSGQSPTRAEMLTEDAARARILSLVEPLSPRALPLLQALGRYSAEAARAVQPLPGFDNSAMDGYAVAFPTGASALEPRTTFAVRGEQAAGPDRGLRVVPGEAIRIFTGAPIPVGTDAVVMQEDTERDGDRIILKDRVESGEFIRRAGGDLARGQVLFASGSRLTAQRLGLFASQGWSEISMGGVPRVAILATGDELRPPGQPLEPGAIYESNGTMLAALVRSLSATVTLLEPARDDRADLDAKMAAGLTDHDVLIVAGGVSVGERDFVKERLAAAGAELNLWRVLIQPGKPFLYGRHMPCGAHVFGLPGNPVSAFVTFLLFVRPALLRLAGASEEQLALPSFPAVAGETLRHDGNRPHYLRGRLDRDGVFFLSGKQESHALFALSQSNALVRVEPQSVTPAGNPVRAYVWEI